MSDTALRLDSLESTQKVGEALAAAILQVNPIALLLQGTLGSGKTTLTRFLVNALPGGDRAEASSPSFTLCNVYPTTPEVRHFDLYRLGKKTLTDALAESFDTKNALTVVEWPEFIHESDRAHDGVLCRFTLPAADTPRLLHLTPLGELGKSFLCNLALTLPHVYFFEGYSYADHSAKIWR